MGSLDRILSSALEKLAAKLAPARWGIRTADCAVER